MTDASIHPHGEDNWRKRLGRNPAWICATVLLTLALMALQPLLALPFVALFAWLSGVTLRDLHLRPFRGADVLLGVAAAIGLQIVNRFAVLPLLAQVTPDAGGGAASVGLVPGAWDAFLIFAPIAVISAGFGEELAARGYAMTRLSVLFGGGAASRWSAMAVVAVIFGLAHFYQGPLGTAHAVFMGFALGALTLTRSSLWTSIAAHGSYNLLTALLIVTGGLETLHQTVPYTAL